MSSVISASIMAGIAVIEIHIHIHMYVCMYTWANLSTSCVRGVCVCMHSITYLLHVAYTHCAYIEQLRVRRAAVRIAFAFPFASFISLFFIYNLLSLLSLLCCKS